MSGDTVLMDSVTGRAAAAISFDPRTGQPMLPKFDPETGYVRHLYLCGAFLIIFHMQNPNQ